jgi:hypothetical protein
MDKFEKVLWGGRHPFPCFMIDSTCFPCSIDFPRSSCLQHPLMYSDFGKVKTTVVTILNFAPWFQMTNQLRHWLQKTQITLRSFKPIFKILKNYSSKNSWLFFHHECSTICLVMNLPNLSSNLSSHNPFLAQNHFICTFNLFQSLQSLLMVILQDLKSFKIFLFCINLLNHFLLVYTIKKHLYIKSHYFITLSHFLRFSWMVF